MEGYKFKTTFWQDFTIADAFGVDAIQDTYDRAFADWRNNTEYLTELVLVLNWKIWQHYEIDDHEEIAKLYNYLWEKLDKYCTNNLKGEDLKYFLEVTD